MNTSPASKIEILKDRAAQLRKARNFFFERNILEVDCPALSKAAPIDQHIDVMNVSADLHTTGYLHTSPEYAMKRLLSQGIGDIYQISHVFRMGESGPLHNPEFTMAEWYRIGISYSDFIEETLDFIRLFLGNLPSARIPYRQALLKYAQIDYVSASCQDLLSSAKKHGIDLPSDAVQWDKDTLLQLLFTFVVEPHLGKECLDVLCDYPSSQAALAQTKTVDDESIAMRFEIYYQGIELANGYHELTDPKEQRNRLIQAQKARKEAGKDPLKIDENFLKALEKGLPDCCGVAVGFDRLMLLRHHQNHLKNILSFSWEEA